MQFFERNYVWGSGRVTLGPLLFNIFLCDPFLIMENIDIASYADDNTAYTTGNSIEEVIQKLENAANRFFSGLVITK